MASLNKSHFTHDTPRMHYAVLTTGNSSISKPLAHPDRAPRYTAASWNAAVERVQPPIFHSHELRPIDGPRGLLSRGYHVQMLLVKEAISAASRHAV